MWRSDAWRPWQPARTRVARPGERRRPCTCAVVFLLRRTYRRVSVRAYACVQTCVDMCADMRRHVYRHVYRPVCRYVYRHVHRLVHGHVCRNVCRHEYEDVHNVYAYRQEYQHARVCGIPHIVTGVCV